MTLIEKRKATTTQEGLWVIEHKGREIGFLTRYRNSRTDTHPWKAHVGIGMRARFLGSWYEKEGGKQAAIDAVLKES